MIAKAIKIAAQVHDGQTDKGGEPYIFHCLTVMRMVGERTKGFRFSDARFREKAMIVAVLHDAIEDFEGTQNDLRQLVYAIRSNFGQDVADALTAMTHADDESYEAYIERVAENPIATIVKICDLTHNMDPRRMPAGSIGDKEFARWEKYRRAIVRLEREQA